MNKLKDKLIRFMYGRYGGNDALNKTLLWTYLIILFVGALTGLDFLWYVGFLALAWNIFRMFSRNTNARTKENQISTGWIFKLKNYIKVKKSRSADFTHIYKKCPNCKAILRLPRRKGKHKTVCPKCSHEFSVRVYRGI